MATLSFIELGTTVRAETFALQCDDGSTIHVDTDHQSVTVSDPSQGDQKQTNVQINDAYIYYGPPEYFIRIMRKTGELDRQDGSQWDPLARCNVQKSQPPN
jgi:hypothetical protein